ncbi:MAG: ATP-binding cassette domain-containing protein [Planctomycetaceae bacterium]|nr:ATP-binding cassette domain-containing protein [Planctomycetaceae bacterium]MBQ2820737.1 ATP-binding cassette domain-containing protein [Thermoguttaceae bacterium]
MTSLLKVEDLTVTFNTQNVLRNISFEISPGERLAIIGESGCGKTVLLKNLIGLIQPTRGRVLFEGTELGKLDEAELARIRINYGFVFQMAALFDSMTIEENLLFPMLQHTKQSRQTMMTTVLKLLDEVGLSSNVLSKRPAELSGGMRKRVGIARALVLQPKIVLYDEPTTGLDPIMTDVINRLMAKMAKNYAITSVIVTHDMTTVRNVADRVIMLYPTSRLKRNEPQILFNGPASEIEKSADRRIHDFVFGDGSSRLNERALD